jgi:hypothetical protein
METPKAQRRLSTIPEAELDSILQDSPTVGLCERYYKCNGEKLPELMAMCLGLRSGDRDLGDATAEPYASMKFRKKVTPTQKHMSEEIKRRARASNIAIPSCTYWTKERLVSWLQDNSVGVPADIVFLKHEEKKLHDVVAKGNSERERDNGGDGSTRGTAWTTNEPYLRLYHSMFHEDVKGALVRMNQVLDRQQLDARNSGNRPETFFEAVARVYNDESIIFITESLPDLHYTFAHPITLSLDDVPGEVTAEECKKRFADARAKLIKIIAKWELSGNGFGQRAVEDAEFGHLGEENLEAGDNRGNFLDSMTKEHILYFWHLADRNELLKNVLNVIADTSAADTETCQRTSDSSSVSSSSRKKAMDARAADEFSSIMGNAMSTMSVAALMTEL